MDKKKLLKIIIISLLSAVLVFVFESRPEHQFFVLI